MVGGGWGVGVKVSTTYSRWWVPVSFPPWALFIEARRPVKLTPHNTWHQQSCVILYFSFILCYFFLSHCLSTREPSFTRAGIWGVSFIYLQPPGRFQTHSGRSITICGQTNHPCQFVLPWLSVWLAGCGESPCLLGWPLYPCMTPRPKVP